MNVRLATDCLLLVSFFVSGGMAQTKSGPNKNKIQKTTPSKQEKPVQPSKDTAAIADAASNALTQIPSPEADYIPCRFTYAELKSLNAPEQVLTLSPAAAESLVEKVTSTIQQQQAAGLISAEVEQALFEDITKSKLSGLTPSEALQSIIKASEEARKSVAPIENTSDSQDEKIRQEEKSASPSSHPKGEPKATIQPESPGRTESANAQTSTVEAAPKTDTATIGKDAQGKQTKKLNPGSETTQNVAPIINSARDIIERLSRPLDVGCAMSVLSYNETSRAFGYIIANNYIAIQVVVRNLNRDQQFVLHDVEYSVNADPAGASGRFYSGRDKVIVRSLASAEGTYDPRNLIVHGAQGLGALLTTLVPIYGGGIGDASAVYNGGFFPALDKVWKDMSTDQLNLLNDTGFSSTSSSQTVVPKAGTSMFVTFVPSKQFEHGWWTQDCVSTTPLGVIKNNQIRALEPLTSTSHSDTSAPTAAIDEALQACGYQAFKKYLALESQSSKKKKTSKESPISVISIKDVTITQQCKELSAKDIKNLSGAETAALAECAPEAMLYVSVPKRTFHHWSGNSVALFQELSTVVVAGIHIVDETTLKPVISSIDCTKDQTGFVVFPSPDTGSIVCPVKGQNLGKVKSLRLRNADESGYIDGSLTQASGDTTAGTVTFVSSALHALNKADYSVAAVSSNNVETATNQFLHFDLKPYVSNTDPPALDMSLIKNPSSFIISGYHLANVSEVDFYVTNPDPSAMAVFKVTPDSLPTDAKIKITLDDVQLAKLGKTAANLKWQLRLADSDKSVSVPITLKYIPPPGSTSAPPKTPASPVKGVKPSKPVGTPTPPSR